MGPCIRIILVTSTYHMYRVKSLFKKVGLKVIPYWVDYKTAGNSIITIMNFFPNGGHLELTETEVRELFGRLFYLIKS